MRFGSLFAGVGGFDLGLEAAGWECAWQVEWDKHCQQTLTHHWPDVPKWWDVSDVSGTELPPVDVITFGSPCQDLSVAGKRAGLDGGRSNLFFEATRIIKEMRDATGGTFPRYAIWENVPGAFSSRNGDDFEAVLKEMADLGACHLEWSVLDAQFFGVPQRRRRVFVVACFDTAILAGSGQQIFAVGEGRRRDSSKGKPSRENLAGETTDRLGASGDTFRMRAFGDYADDDCASALKQRDYKDATDLVVETQWAAGADEDDVLRTSECSKWSKGTGGPSGSEFYNLVVDPIVFSHTQGLDAQPSVIASPTLRSNGAGMAVAHDVVHETSPRPNE